MSISSSKPFLSNPQSEWIQQNPRTVSILLPFGDWMSITIKSFHYSFPFLYKLSDKFCHKAVQKKSCLFLARRTSKSTSFALWDVPLKHNNPPLLFSATLGTHILMLYVQTQLISWEALSKKFTACAISFHPDINEGILTLLLEHHLCVSKCPFRKSIAATVRPLDEIGDGYLLNPAPPPSTPFSNEYPT